METIIKILKDLLTQKFGHLFIFGANSNSIRIRIRETLIETYDNKEVNMSRREGTDQLLWTSSGDLFLLGCLTLLVPASRAGFRAGTLFLGLKLLWTEPSPPPSSVA